jgi:hypothetical protein
MGTSSSYVFQGRRLKGTGVVLGERSMRKVEGRGVSMMRMIGRWEI